MGMMMGEHTTDFSGKLNFTLGEENINGRIYDPDMFEQAIIDALRSSDGIPISRNGFVTELSDIIGWVTSYEIDENHVTFKGKVMKDFSFATETLTVAGTGNLDGNEVTDFSLENVFPSFPPESVPSDDE